MLHFRVAVAPLTAYTTKMLRTVYGVLSVRSVGRRALEAVPALRTDKTP